MISTAGIRILQQAFLDTGQCNGLQLLAGSADDLRLNLQQAFALFFRQDLQRRGVADDELRPEAIEAIEHALQRTVDLEQRGIDEKFHQATLHLADHRHAGIVSIGGAEEGDAYATAALAFPR